MILKYILNLIFPEKCVGCGLEENYLCKNCVKGLKFSIQEEKIKNKYFHKLISFGSYKKGSLLQKLILKIKYKYSKEIFEIFEKIIEKNIPNIMENSIIVPVPIQKPRLKERGFNQSFLLAKIIRKYCKNAKVVDCLKFDSTTSPQTKLSRRDRIKNMNGKIKIIKKFNGIINNKNILLVDDVITTGSTLNECAKILKNAGVGKICCMVLAKN